MKMKLISQSKSFYGFCLIKVYKLTFSSFCSCGSIVYPVKSTNYNPVACSQTLYFLGWGGGVILGILGGGAPPGSPNPDPISDQKM